MIPGKFVQQADGGLNKKVIRVIKRE